MRKLVVLFISISMLLLAVQCGKPASDKADKDGKQTKSDSTDKSAAKTKGDKKGADEKGKDEKETEAVPVQVVKPTVGDISSFLLFSSNIDSEKVVDIYPMTMGIIRSINFDEGQAVKKDDILATLDDREASLAEQRAEINFKNLQAEFQRKKEIYEKQMLSREDFERLKYNMENAELEWKQAKLMLSYTRITTPISGVVTKRYIKVGNKINTSQLSFSVVEDKEKIAAVNIPQQEKKDLFLKQKVEIYSGAQKTGGLVKRISPAIDPESGTFKVTVEVHDSQSVFSVGQFVNVKIIKKVHADVILLTKDAIVYEGGKVFVFVVDDQNEAVKKPVALGFEDGNRVEITEGLTKDEQVVTAGKSSLKSKTLVKIIEPLVG